jgi:hypothetical protein
MPTGDIRIAAHGPERLIQMDAILQKLRFLYYHRTKEYKLQQLIQCNSFKKK